MLKASVYACRCISGIQVHLLRMPVTIHRLQSKMNAKKQTLHAYFHNFDLHRSSRKSTVKNFINISLFATLLETNVSYQLSKHSTSRLKSITPPHLQSISSPPPAQTLALATNFPHSATSTAVASAILVIPTNPYLWAFPSLNLGNHRFILSLSLILPQLNFGGWLFLVS